MTEATNIWTATANEITKAVRESLIAMGCGDRVHAHQPWPIQTF